MFSLWVFLSREGARSKHFQRAVWSPQVRRGCLPDRAVIPPGCRTHWNRCEMGAGETHAPRRLAQLLPPLPHLAVKPFSLCG